MRIALLQYPIEWADPQANIGLLDERLRAIADDLGVTLVPQVNVFGHAASGRMDNGSNQSSAPAHGQHL